MFCLKVTLRASKTSFQNNPNTGHSHKYISVVGTDYPTVSPTQSKVSQPHLSHYYRSPENSGYHFPFEFLTSVRICSPVCSSAYLLPGIQWEGQISAEVVLGVKRSSTLSPCPRLSLMLTCRSLWVLCIFTRWEQTSRCVRAAQVSRVRPSLSLCRLRCSKLRRMWRRRCRKCVVSCRRWHCFTVTALVSVSVEQEHRLTGLSRKQGRNKAPRAEGCGISQGSASVCGGFKLHQECDLSLKFLILIVLIKLWCSPGLVLV